MDPAYPKSVMRDKCSEFFTEEVRGFDGAHTTPTYDKPARTPLDNGGSMVLIDPMTSGIIGTLTPASPEAIVKTPSSTFNNRSDKTDGDATAPTSDGAALRDKLDRRDSTYTYRLSISDVSLRTYRPGQGSDDGLPHLATSSLVCEPIDPVTEQMRHGSDDSRMRSSWMTDEASFWTARGTLKMDEGGAEGKEREVVVAFVKADKDLDDLFSPYMPPPLASRSPQPDPTPETIPSSVDTLRPGAQIPSHLSTATNTTDSPFPSRILHLFPRLSTLPRGGGSVGSGLPTSPSGNLVWPGLGGLEGLDPASLVASAQSHAEAAFWRMIMPGISGIYGWSGMLGSAYHHVSSYLPNAALLEAAPLIGASSAPLLIDTDHLSSSHTPRLYSEETIYTPRIPVSSDEKGIIGNGADIGIGPTMRPVWVKKRAALPVFQEREEDWGRQGVLYR